MSLFIYFILSCAAVSQSCSARVWRQVVSHPAKHNVPETCYPDVKGPACSASDWIFGFYRYICKNKINRIPNFFFLNMTLCFFFFFFTLMKLSHKILSVVKVVIKEWVLYFFSLFILFYIISFVWFLWNSLFYFSQDQCVICLVCGKTFFFFSTEDIWKMFNLLVLVERCFPKRHLEWWGFIYHSRCHLLACHSERCLEYHNEMTWLIIHTIEVACASVLMLKF